MQRIGKQQKTIHQPRRFGCQNAGLPAAVGVSAQPQAAWVRFADFEYFHAEAFAIARRLHWPWRTMRPLLAKWQIIADYVRTVRAECIRERDQQRRITIRTGAMCEDKGFQTKKGHLGWVARRLSL